MLHSDPALDYPRTHSRQDQYPPPSPSEGSFNPYTRDSSIADTSSPSQQNLAPHSIVQGPAPGYLPAAGQPYEQSLQGQEPKPGDRPQSGRRSIRTKLLAAAATAKEEVREDRSKHTGLFGRRRSVRKESPSATKQEPSLYSQNAAQWNSDHAQAPTSGLGSSERFEPLSPDFTLEQPPDTQESQLSQTPLHLQSQQQSQQQFRQQPHQLLQPHSLPQGHPEQPNQPLHQIHTAPYPETTQRFDSLPRSQLLHQQPPPGQLAEGTPTSAESNISPDRPSLDSLQRPPSRPDPNSRSSSRASYDPYHASQQTFPYRAYQDTNIQEVRHQGLGQDSNSNNTYRPYALQRPQLQSGMPPQQGDRNMPNFSGISRDSTGSLQPVSAPIDGSHNPSGSIGSSPLNPKLQAGPREDANGRALPPSRAPSDLTEIDVHQMLEAHRKDAYELHDIKKKYSNVKKQFFTQKDQIDKLQNALAHQRLSQSRTQLDDGEYVKRMERLNGQIKSTAYAVRNHWAKLPEWLELSCNKNAVQLGKQEMTAVGRAFMSRWLADQVFDKYFHPDVPADLSAALKTIQKNMRTYAPPYQGEEEKEALTAKINTWRLATVDGLKPVLASEHAATNRQEAMEALGQQLLQDITQFLKESPPTDLATNIPSIIELAVGILANLPLESRDVHIGYFSPGVPIFEQVMQLEEAKIPPLISGDTHETDQVNVNEISSAHPKDSEDPSRKGFLGSIMGGKKGSKGTNSPAQPNSIQPTPVASPVIEEQEPRVRLCVFLEMEVRGKMVLLKAPVYTM